MHFFCLMRATCTSQLKHLWGILEIRTNLTFETGAQTGCTKAKGGGDVFWARSVTSHVAEMLTNRRVGTTASQHFCCWCQANRLTFGLLRACCPVSSVSEHVEHCLFCGIWTRKCNYTRLTWQKRQRRENGTERMVQITLRWYLLRMGVTVWHCWPVIYTSIFVNIITEN